MADSLDITGNFDGGNPQDPDAIIQTGANAFTIIPFSEDNDPNYKFRLDLKVFNHSSASVKVHLDIDWQEPRFNHLRNYVYLKHSEDTDWSYHRMRVNQTRAMGAIECRPGETYVCLHPRYTYGDYLRCVAGIPESEFVKKEIIGFSAEGRELWMVKVGVENEHARKRIMLVARIHPYETAGSYCIEGIIDHFSKNLSPFTSHLSPFPFHLSHFPFPISPLTFNLSPTHHLSPIYLIPMANPDGVYNGFCKRTARDGVDVSKILDFNDPVAAAIRKAVDAVRPTIYGEFHNWMFKDVDGIYYLNRLQAWRFKRMFPSQKPFKKKWRTGYKWFFWKTPPVGFKKYCSDKFNSICLALEFPWFERSTDDMKKIGAQSAVTLAKTL